MGHGRPEMGVSNLAVVEGKINRPIAEVRGLL